MNVVLVVTQLRKDPALFVLKNLPEQVVRELQMCDVRRPIPDRLSSEFSGLMEGMPPRFWRGADCYRLSRDQDIEIRIDLVILLRYTHGTVTIPDSGA